MPAVTDVEQQFRTLHQETIHAYEEKLKRRREQRERSIKRQQHRQEQVHEILRAAEMDVKRLDRLIQEDEAALRDVLDDVRSPMIDRPPRRQEDAARLALSQSFEIPNRRQVNLYGATLLASSPANLEGNPGEQGNPWVQPWNPGHTKIKAWDAGNGWGCWAQPQHPNTDASATFWFLFIPDSTATWNLLTLVNLHGFYILDANDEWWNCKESAAHANVIMDVYQYYWNGAKHFDLVNIDQDNINESDLYDDPGQFDYQVMLRAGDWAFVAVTISLHTFAKGGGSYSELNFSDGNANYLEPLITFAWTV